MKKTMLILIPGALLLFTVCGALAQNNNAASTNLNIHIRDYCDPKSFNAAAGPGTCERAGSTLNPLSNGAITFQGFVAEVTLDKSVGAWRFVPSQVKVERRNKIASTKFRRRNSHFYRSKEVWWRVYRIP